MRKRLLLILTLFATSAGATRAASGTALDDSGVPVQGAAACLISEGRSVLCVDTDVNGYYTLPDVRVSTVRITKAGYLPATIAAVPQEAPVVLVPAASLRVTVVDAATGKRVGGGTIVLSYPSGRMLDDLPFTEGGTRVATLPAGAAKVRAVLAGFRSEIADVLLEAGREAAVEVKVREER